MKFKRSRAEYITNVVLVAHVLILIVLIISMGFANYFWSYNHQNYEYIFYGVTNYPLFAF